jgi:hypothetical protein
MSYGAPVHNRLVKEKSKYIRRLENLSWANLLFYQEELRKLEREIIITNVEGRVSESAISKATYPDEQIPYVIWSFCFLF